MRRPEELINYIKGYAEKEPEYGSVDKFVWYPAGKIMPLIEYIEYLDSVIEKLYEERWTT